MAAKLHFITGKGGVGKSTFAAALTRKLTASGRGPVLLIDVQGSGYSLRLLGREGAPFENTPLPKVVGAYGTRILPRETFKQYFGLLLSLGHDQSTFASATAALRTKLVDIVFENKIVSAFIDVCPGLEPAVLAGKIHWECLNGRSPGDADSPWSDVIVDAPATGHGLMLFKSVSALTEVFGAGLIFRQAGEIMKFFRDPRQTMLYLATLPEELPVAEAIEMARELKTLRLPLKHVLLNRRSTVEKTSSDEVPAPWHQEVEFERARAEEETEAERLLRQEIPEAQLHPVPDLAALDEYARVEEIAARWMNWETP